MKNFQRCIPGKILENVSVARWASLAFSIKQGGVSDSIYCFCDNTLHQGILRNQIAERASSSCPRRREPLLAVAPLLVGEFDLFPVDLEVGLQVLEIGQAGLAAQALELGLQVGWAGGVAGLDCHCEVRVYADPSIQLSQTGRLHRAALPALRLPHAQGFAAFGAAGLGGVDAAAQHQLTGLGRVCGRDGYCVGLYFGTLQGKVIQAPEMRQANSSDSSNRKPKITPVFGSYS